MTRGSRISVLIGSLALLKVILLLILSPEVKTFENFQIAQNYHQTCEMFYWLDGNKDYNHQFPLFGWCLIVLHGVFGENMIGYQLFQIVLSGLSSFFVFRLFQKVAGKFEFKAWIGYVLIFVLNFHPVLFYYQLYVIHPLMMDTLCFSTLLYVTFLLCDQFNWKYLLLFAVVVGICSLERVTLVSGSAMIFLMFAFKKDWINLLKVSVFLILGVGLFTGPWMMRNYIKTGHLQLTSGTYRYLWVGAQEETDGTNVLENGDSYYELFPQQIKDSWSDKNLEEQLSFYKKDYQKMLNVNFEGLILMWLKRIKNYFWISENSGASYDGGTRVLFDFYKWFHRCFLFIFLLSIYKLRNNKMVIGFVSAMISLGLVQSFFYIELRHSMPSIWIIYLVSFIYLSGLKTISTGLGVRN